jgi:hypothetical protein
MSKTGLLSLLGILLLVGAADAAEKKAPPPLEPVFFRSGEVLHARIRKLEESKVHLELAGRKKMVIGIREIAPEQVYFLRLRGLDEKTAKAHHALAAYCLENGLRGLACREYDKIGTLQPELADVVKIWKERTGATEKDFLYARAWEAVAGRKFRDARNLLGEVIKKHGKEDVGKRAEKFYPAINRMTYIGRVELLDGLSPQVQRFVVYFEGKIDRVPDTLAEAAKTAKEGKVTRARDAYESTEKTLLLGRRLYKASYDECRTRSGRVFLKERRKNLESVLVRVYAASAGFYIEIRSWGRAKEKVDRGLALDRKNPALMRLRETVRRNWERSRLRGD